MKDINLDFNNIELQITKYVAEGLSNKQIGEKLYLTESSVKAYINRIMRKLELHNRTQLAVYFVKNYIDA